MKRTLPIIGVILMAGGFLLLGTLLWSNWNPPNAPYSYVMVSEGKTAKFPELGLKDHPDLNIQKYEIRVPEIDKPIVDFHVALKDGAKPVLLDWHNHTTDPVVTTDSKASESETLAKAIAKYASPDALILGWWDTSRRVRLLSGKKVLFDEYLAKPVLVPEMWNSRKHSIEALERSFWKVSDAGKTAASFDAFIDAMLSDEVIGTAMLRQLGGGREVIVVVHLSDAFKIGALEPDRLSIGYKDFGSSTQLHGIVRHIKKWVKENGHKAYTVLPIGDKGRRVYFLSDTRSTETLIARMLPFTTSNPVAMDGLRIVYQHGGYWVYKLPASNVKAQLDEAQSAQPAK